MFISCFVFFRFEMAAEYADEDDQPAILDLRNSTLEELNLHDSDMKVSFKKLLKWLLHIVHQNRCLK